MSAADDAYEAAANAIAAARFHGKTELHLDDQRFRHLRSLPPEISAFTDLKALSLPNTLISDISLLSTLTGIEVLLLNDTQVSEISALSAMTRMKRLYLDNTKVSDLAPLAAMSGLRWLSLNKTNVADLRPLLGPLRSVRGKQFLLFIQSIPATVDPQIRQISQLSDATRCAEALYEFLDGGWHPPQPSVSPPFHFLSYASQNRPQIETLHRFLSAQSMPLWWDQDIPPGAAWRDEIQQRLGTARSVVTFWTEASTASKAVIEEAATAQKDGRLVHVRLDDARLPYGFGETQYIDLRGWDGSATHPQMAKLLRALHDRLNPPDAKAMTDRLAAANPIGMLPEGKRLSAFDTPPHTRPDVENQPDLDQRFDGLKAQLKTLQTRAADRDNYQFPADLGHSLGGVHDAIYAMPRTWYGIEAARDSLHFCMVYHDAKNSWNAPTFHDLTQLLANLSGLQPLLQPRQVPPGQPGAKPPEPDPVVKNADLPKVQAIAGDLNAAAVTPQADETLNPDAVAALQAGAAEVDAAAKIPDPDKRAPKLRKAVRRMIYATGAVLTALSTETIASLLANSEAAAALAAQLRPIFDALLKFFL